MIVDIHTHCIQPEHVSDYAHRSMERAGYSPMQPLTPEEYARGMEPVDFSIVFGITATQSGVRVPNEFTAEWVGHDPTKRMGFMTLDVFDGGSIEEMHRAKEDLGLRGIKLYPTSHPFNPADTTVFPLYAAAQRLQLPILFHMGTSPGSKDVTEYSHPLLIDKVARSFPDLKMVIAHLAHPWQRETAIVVRKQPNVFTDVSALWVRPWAGLQALILCLEWGVSDKLLFGSDFPFWTPQEGMDKLRRLNEQVAGTPLPHLPDEMIEGIIHRDSLALLGLDN